MSHLLIESTDYISIFAPIIAMLCVPSGIAVADEIHRRVTERQNGTISGSTYRVRHNGYSLMGFIVGTIFTAFFALLFPILYICGVKNGPDLGMTIGIGCVFGLFTALLLVMLIGCKRYGIEVSEERLVYTPHVGKRITFTWKDINSMRSDNVGNIRMTLKNHNIVVNFNSNVLIGGEKFLNDLKNHCILLVGTFI